MLRRTLLLSALSGSVALLVGHGLSAQELTRPPSKSKERLAKSRQRNIKIHASRFVFSPNHITLTQGDVVVLELTSSDFTHGFSIPDLGVRTDIPPGQVTLLTITPELAGDIIFLCDNFCGEGHEKMQGKFTVEASS
jgi:cytochrome c oxidase subunit 2